MTILHSDAVLEFGSLRDIDHCAIYALHEHEFMVLAPRLHQLGVLAARLDDLAHLGCVFEVLTQELVEGGQVS
jgi:hypothetical protein